jgi:hypothetical protein
MKKLFTILAIACAVMPLATGCAVDSEDPPPATTHIPDQKKDDATNMTENQDDVVTGACDDGEIRDCKIQINENNCFVGEQVCDGGVWGDCEDLDNQNKPGA